MLKVRKKYVYGMNTRMAIIYFTFVLVLVQAMPMVLASNGTNWCFEDFTTSSALTLQGGGGKSIVNTSTGKLEIARTSTSSFAAATYSFQTPISASTLVTEFDVTMNGTDTKELMLRVRNSASAELTRYVFKQAGSITVKKSTVAQYETLSTGITTMSNNETVRFKSVINLSDTGETAIQTYINGNKVSKTVGYWQTISPVDISNLNFNINGDTLGVGCSVIIDNFKTYTVGSEAEKVALSSAGLKIADDLNNISANPTLPVSDSVNGTSISWQSSNPAVIANDGTVVRPTNENVNVTLRATITSNTDNNMVCTKDFPVVVTFPVASLTGADWMFIHFNAPLDANWSIGAGRGIVGVNTQTGKLEIERTSDGGSTANATLSLPANLQISSGKLAVEFTFAMNGIDNKELQYSFRNANNSDQFNYRFRQGERNNIYIRNVETATTMDVDFTQKLPKEREMHIKTVIDLDVESGSVESGNYTRGAVYTYVNGELSDVVKTLLKPLDTSSLSKLYFNMADTNSGGKIAIDNLKIYKVNTLPTDAEALANYTYQLGIGANNLNNVTNNLTLASSNSEADITWESDQPAVISPEGIVTRPTDTDAVVNMTATLKKNNTVMDIKTFRCVVPANVGALSYINDSITFNSGRVVDVVKRGSTILGSVNINNDTQTDESGVVLLALYDSITGQLINIAFDSYTAPATTAGYVKSVSLAVPEIGTQYYAKRLILRNMNSLSPVRATISTLIYQ